MEERWGEQRPAFYNGPTAPDLKRQWSEPIEWSEGRRSHSYAVPSGGLLGTGATDLRRGRDRLEGARPAAPKPGLDAARAQAVEIENRSAIDGLRRSTELVRGHWLRVASLVGLGALLALGAGPFLGALLTFLTGAPLPLLKVVAGVVYALAIPFVAVVTAYVYFDTRARDELEPGEAPAELRAEIELSAGT